MTLQIKECIQETVNPLGVMVVVEAKHMCMQMRGVEKQNAITTTSDFTGDDRCQIALIINLQAYRCGFTTIAADIANKTRILCEGID